MCVKLESPDRSRNGNLKTGLLIPPTHIKMQDPTSFFLLYFFLGVRQKENIWKEVKKLGAGGGWKLEIRIQKYHKNGFGYFKFGLTKKH